jgi:hypothetical protein
MARNYLQIYQGLTTNTGHAANHRETDGRPVRLRTAGDRIALPSKPPLRRSQSRPTNRSPQMPTPEQGVDPGAS